MDDWPEGTLVGLALKLSVGAGGLPCTSTVTVLASLPPGPVQVSEKLLVLVKAPVD